MFLLMTLLLVFLPSVGWYLNISLIDAFIMDIAVAGFYMVYAFFYNWAYDLIFPIPNATPGANSGARPAAAADVATRDCQSAN